LLKILCVQTSLHLAFTVLSGIWCLFIVCLLAALNVLHFCAEPRKGKETVCCWHRRKWRSMLPDHKQMAVTLKHMRGLRGGGLRDFSNINRIDAQIFTPAEGTNLTTMTEKTTLQFLFILRTICNLVGLMLTYSC
jgi:hypothetical protein